jgi:predicted phage terminase large subunit-like protein
MHHRRAGDVLAPEREPQELLDAIKLQIGSQAFSAQYLQAPEPPGGAMIKRAWIRRYEKLPPIDRRSVIIQSWDTANKGGPDNDFSVCTTWLYVPPVNWYLCDVFRGRVDYPTLKAKIILMANGWRGARVLIEDAGSGSSLIQELRRQIPGVIAVRPEGDKEARLSAVSAKFEAGQVWLPTRAPWLADYEAELFSFPASRHDDQCDSTSQALSDSVSRRATFMLQFAGVADSSPPDPKFRKPFRFDDPNWRLRAMTKGSRWR